MSSVNHITYCQAGQLFGIHVKNLNKISILLDLERTQEMWLYQTLHDGTIHWVLRKTEINSVSVDTSWKSSNS